MTIDRVRIRPLRILPQSLLRWHSLLVLAGTGEEVLDRWCEELCDRHIQTVGVLRQQAVFANGDALRNLFWEARFSRSRQFPGRRVDFGLPAVSAIELLRFSFGMCGLPRDWRSVAA